MQLSRDASRCRCVNKLTSTSVGQRQPTMGMPIVCKGKAARVDFNNDEARESVSGRCSQR